MIGKIKLTKKGSGGGGINGKLETHSVATNETVTSGDFVKKITEYPVVDTNYSHTSNISDDGTQDGNYPTSSSTNEVITITGATQLQVSITYQTRGSSYAWACMWEGNQSSYTAYANYSSSVTGKLSGTSKTTKTYTVNGDTVTFGFYSNSTSPSSYGYGYYAVITGVDVQEKVKRCIQSDTILGVSKDSGYNGSNVQVYVPDV